MNWELLIIIKTQHWLKGPSVETVRIPFETEHLCLESANLIKNSYIDKKIKFDLYCFQVKDEPKQP